MRAIIRPSWLSLEEQDIKSRRRQNDGNDCSEIIVKQLKQQQPPPPPPPPQQQNNSPKLNCLVIRAGWQRTKAKTRRRRIGLQRLPIACLLLATFAISLLLLDCHNWSSYVRFVVAAEQQIPPSLASSSSPGLSLPPLTPLASGGGGGGEMDEEKTDETLGDMQNSGDNGDTDQVEPCEACRLVVSSFEKGMELTARGKHEGGDTSWEEKNLKSYADSEVRLVEIQEQICQDLPGGLKGKAQCLSLAEDTESYVEEWWFNHRKKNVRLHDYLCISKLKRCCADGKFGPTCQACPSDCNNHGSCNGSGTRTGTGKCICESGYEGEECSECTPDYFRIATGDHFACRKCDSACSGCYGPGQTNCTQCREGYYKHELNGCIDINECDISEDLEGNARLCKGSTYCINTDGSYRCADCHVACSRCIGYGPNMCLSCARGYDRDDEMICRSSEELEKMDSWEREDSFGDLSKTSSAARYFIYAGMIIVVSTMFGFRLTNLYVMFFFVVVVLLLLSGSSFKIDLRYSESSSE